MKKIRVPLALTLAAVMLATGCQQTSQQTSQGKSRGGFTSQQTSQRRPVEEAPPAKDPEPAVLAEAAPAPQVGCINTTGGLIQMSKAMPAEASLGGEFTAELVIEAQGCAANVIVSDSIPENAIYVRSEPAGVIEGDNLVWRIGNMDAGQVINAKIWFRADQEGTIVNCAWVSADPRVCGATFVGKPVLAIDKSGPESAILGSEVTYNIVVKNTGTSIARNVVVTDPVPEGMSHSSGNREVSFDVGNLATGESKPFAVTFTADQRGNVCNTASAKGSNTTEVSDDACTLVLVPGLEIEKTGTERQILGRNADYQIVVSNTGDTTLTDVVVVDTAPAETSIVSAPGASLDGNKATWSIAEMKPGTQRALNVKLGSKTAGTHCNVATATSGALTASDDACTAWRGIAAVLLEAVDNPDPIEVGENTTYSIRVTNQGFADIHNVQIVVTFDDEIEPLSCPEGTINGNTVTFRPVDMMDPKQVLAGTIVVKGIKVGDSRNKIVLTCDELSSPVEETESTTVY